MAKVSTNLGKVATTPKGEYSNETTYIRLDIVSYNGSSYVCLKESVGNLPTNTEYWQLIASKGDTGAKGQDGQDGYTPVKGVDYFTQEDIASLNIPSKTSDITNDSGFITNSVNNLVNYYLKNEIYTKDEVTALIGAIQQFHYEVVQELPQTGANNIMYLVPKSTSQTNNVYDEYVYSNGWEKIGDTEIDLSNYVTITMLNQALADYTTTANLTTLLTQKQDLLTAGENISIDNNVISASENNILYFDMSTARYKPEFTRNTTELLNVANGNSNRIAIDYSPIYFKICSILNKGIKPLINISFGNNSGFSATRENNYLFYVNNYTTDTYEGETFYKTIELTGINYVDDANFTNSRKVYLILRSNTGTAVNSLSMADKIMLPTDLSGKQDTLIAGDNITIQNNVISASGGGSDIPFYSILGTSSWINWDGSNAITSSDSSASYWQEYIDLYLEQKTNNKPLPLLYYYIYNNQDVSYRYKENVLFTPYHIISMGSSYNGIVLFGNAISRNFNMTGGISYMSTLSNVAKETIMPVIIIETDKNYNFFMAVPQNILRPSDVLKISGEQTISGVKKFNTLPVSSVTPTTSNQLTNKSYVDSVPTTYTGYDATKTQVLKNINGTFTWVDES